MKKNYSIERKIYFTVLIMILFYAVPVFAGTCRDPGFTSYGIRPGFKANIRPESNIFKNFSGQSTAAGGAKNNIGECLVFNYAFNRNDFILETIGDVFINCTDKGIDADEVEGGTFGNGTSFIPPYDYTIDSTSSLETVLKANIGATLEYQ